MIKFRLGLLTAVLWAVSAPTMAADNAVILMYHHVSDSMPASTSVTPEVFEQHLQYLADGYNVISLEQAIGQLKNEKPLPVASTTHSDPGAAHRAFQGELYGAQLGSSRALLLVFPTVVCPATRREFPRLSRRATCHGKGIGRRQFLSVVPVILTSVLTTPNTYYNRVRRQIQLLL